MFKRLRDLLYGQTPEETESLRPSSPAPEPPTGPPERESASEVSSLDQGEAYLERVQAKINKLAEEFAAGNINRVQFQELYDHYRREQQTIQRWIELSPDSEAWKDASSEGKSIIIRRQYVAKVLGYAVYENESGMPLNTIGEFEIEADLAIPMLSSYRAATREIFGAGMRSTEIEGGRWVSYVPGEFTTMMALFSTEPASRQLSSLDELHRLFERANRTLLAQQPVDPDQLVFPHGYFLGRVG
jgi:hypothetical protein